MAARKLGGPIEIRLSRDERMHKVYKVSHEVEVDNFTNIGGTESPVLGVPEAVLAALGADGLPAPGDAYTFEEVPDDWVYCLPNAEVYAKPGQKPGPKRVYIVEQQFTSRAIERRIDTDREDPLLEHDVFDFGTNSFTEEAVFDRFGHRIQYSSHEAIRGPQNEWDMGRVSINVEHVSASLDLDQVGEFMNCVNDAPIWSASIARCLKLSRCTVKQLFWKFTTYYRFNYGFELWIRRDDPLAAPSSGWDRDVLDEGTKVLRGRWQNFGTPTVPVWSWVLVGNPNPNNPGDFVRYQDVNGNLTRVILDGAGRPYAPTGGATVTTCTQCPTGSPQKWDVQNAWPVWYSSLNGQLVTYVSGCTWLAGVSPTISNPPNISGGGLVGITLEYAPATTLWTLTVTGLKTGNGTALGQQKWTKTTATWNCNATNTMTPDAANSIYTNHQAIVTPAVANSPGQINLQKYPSANFLELGLAASFD